MSRLLHFGEVIAVNANLFPDKIGARDLARSLTFRAWNERSCRLANALRHLHDCSGCFRLERSPGGICTHWKAPPSHGARK
jgi:hypothetical protein